MLNHITVMGRLTADPELRRTGSGVAVASFTVAVDRDYNPQGQDKETDFIPCVVWRNTGEFVSKYFTRGRMIVVDGRLQIRSWTDKDGNKRRTAEIVADHCYFGDSKREDGNSSNHGGSSYGSAPAPSYGGGYGGGYNQPTQNNYGVYAGPSDGPDDYALLEGEDAHLPF